MDWVKIEGLEKGPSILFKLGKLVLATYNTDTSVIGVITDTNYPKGDYYNVKHLNGRTSRFFSPVFVRYLIYPKEKLQEIYSLEVS